MASIGVRVGMNYLNDQRSGTIISMPENFVRTVEISTGNLAWKNPCQEKGNGINGLGEAGIGTGLAYVRVHHRSLTNR